MIVKRHRATRAYLHRSAQRRTSPKSLAIRNIRSGFMPGGDSARSARQRAGAALHAFILTCACRCLLRTRLGNAALIPAGHLNGEAGCTSSCAARSAWFTSKCPRSFGRPPCGLRQRRLLGGSPRPRLGRGYRSPAAGLRGAHHAGRARSARKYCRPRTVRSAIVGGAKVSTKLDLLGGRGRSTSACWRSAKTGSAPSIKIPIACAAISLAYSLLSASRSERWASAKTALAAHARLSDEITPGLTPGLRTAPA
jgi:hypothetical protein